MNISTHPVASEEVMAFLDGELSTADAQAVSAHVDHCAECGNLAEQLRSTSRSLSRWNVQDVPPRLEASLKNLAAKASSDPRIGKANIFIRVSVWSWKQWAIAGGGTVAALLFALAIAVPILHHSQRLAEISGTAASRGAQQPITDQQSKRFQNGSSSLSSLVTQASPGIAADSNGLFHGLGDHSETSFTPSPMIARTVSLSIVVEDFAASRSSLDVVLVRHHGYSAQLNISTPENAPRSLQASLRIPAPDLSSAVANLKTLGRVENESQSGEEVTQQHTDLVARLKTSHDTEQRFRTILQQRTGNVSEVLQVEEGIARVRGDIERMEAEQKALEHRVDFATLELQVTEEYKAQLNPPAASVSTRIHNAFVAGYRNGSEAVLGIVLFFAEYGPTLLVLLAVLLLPIIFVWRRFRKMLATV
jgi:hypothetical protein